MFSVFEEFATGLKRPVLAGPGEIPSACATQAFPHCQDLLSFHSFHSCMETTIWLSNIAMENHHLY